MGPLGRPGANATCHPLGEIVVVSPAVQTDGPVVLAPFDRMKRLLHSDN
jgi:hypothetical protein